MIASILYAFLHTFVTTFAAGEVIRLLWIKFRVPFGGPKGLKLIPGFPDIAGGSFFGPVAYYYLALVVVVISLAILYRIEHSRIGLTFHAVHWQDQLASSVGVDTRPAWPYMDPARLQQAGWIRMMVTTADV